MAAQFHHSSNNAPIPRPNPQVLAESLRNGELNLATAISQFSALIRETLKIIEEFAEEQVKLNLERKTKVDKMDKLINDLSEKCQGMQQALLYKEEKYDEKCREVERYKVICELSAKAAVSDSSYYTNQDENNNLYNNMDRKDRVIKVEDQQVEMAPPEQAESRRSVKSHTKLNQNQMHLSRYVNALRPDSPRSCRDGPHTSDEEDDRRSLMAEYYVGGPCKRRLPPRKTTDTLKDARVKERLEIIGGINVRGPQTNSGPVPVDRLYRPTNDPLLEDPNKRVKIALTGQSNEIMSSSGNMAHQMKQRFTEKDLHRQVAGGCWTRMASRRKKDWPF